MNNSTPKFYMLPLYILVRPIKGFYALKFEKQGRMWLALANYLAVCISMAIMTQYSSVLVNFRNPAFINSMRDFFITTIALVLFCVSNWAVTSITDGEGKLKEIFMTVCYAMTPITLLFIPATVLSNVLTSNEVGFYFMLVSFATFWFAVLTVVGLIVIHDYGVGKALATFVLTIVALLVIVFLLTLLLTLVQQLYVFLNGLWTEITLRL